jgi:hypothetical protein
VGDFNTPLSSTDRNPDQKISKDILELNNTMNEMDLTTFIEYLILQQIIHFFSAAHRTFSKIDHILGHKGNLNKCKIK